MESTIIEALEKIFEKQKKDYLPFSQLKKFLPASVITYLSINIKKISQKDLELHISPHLPPEYSFCKKRNTRYLLRRSVKDIVKYYLKANPDLTLNQVFSRLPFQRHEIAEMVNTLVEEGDAVIIAIPQTNSFGMNVKVKEKGSYSVEEFRKGFQITSNGKSYVKIYELRRFLSWPTNEFDSCLQSLWDEGIIELQVSDPSLLTQEQQRDSYKDKSNTLRILLLWREE